MLPRVVGVLAARAGLTLDRLNDATLVADVIAASASPGRGQLALRLERFEDGSSCWSSSTSRRAPPSS